MINSDNGLFRCAKCDVEFEARITRKKPKYCKACVNRNKENNRFVKIWQINRQLDRKLRSLTPDAAQEFLAELADIAERGDMDNPTRQALTCPQLRQRMLACHKRLMKLYPYSKTPIYKNIMIRLDAYCREYRGQSFMAISKKKPAQVEALPMPERANNVIPFPKFEPLRNDEKRLRIETIISDHYERNGTQRERKRL